MTDDEHPTKMSNGSFKFMNFLFKLLDFIHPYVKKRAMTFGISKGMTVIDYGCGPGRYTREFSKIVGDDGKVYAVDIHEMAIEEVDKMVEKLHLKNVETVLAKGYHCPLPDKTADIICAIDMFFMIKNPVEFLEELKRLSKNDGILIIDDEHQKREAAIDKIQKSGYWEIFDYKKDHFRCRPVNEDY